MKRDAGVNAVFFLSKKTAFTPASLFIFKKPTDVMALATTVFPKIVVANFGNDPRGRY